MKLTPLDIRKQEFKRAIRGFDAIEVQTFLDMVAEEYESLLDDNKMLNRRLVEFETKLKDYQENEKNLRETLLNVQEVKKQSEESSRRQADLIMKESELKAMEIVELARKQARKMRDEVTLLRTQKESFINRLRQILISQVELLSVLEMEDAIPEEAHEFVESARRRRKTALKSSANNLKETKEDKEEANQESTDIELDEEKFFEAEEESTEEDEEDFQVTEDTDKEEPEEDTAEKEPGDGKKTKEKPEKKLKEEDIDDFFKKGIQIDEIIKNLDKKQQK